MPTSPKKRKVLFRRKAKASGDDDDASNSHADSDSDDSTSKPAAKKKGRQQKKEIYGEYGMVITIENEQLHNKLEESKFFILQHLDQCDAPLSDGKDGQHKKIMSFVTSDGMTQNGHCLFPGKAMDVKSIHKAVPILKILEDCLEALTGKGISMNVRLNLLAEHLRHADRANNFVRAIVTLASKTNEKEIRFFIGGLVGNLVYTVRCPSNTVMMMDRQCSGIDSLPGWKSTKGNPIRMKHEVKNCTGVFSVICDIYQNKDKTLTFEEVVGAVRKAFKSNAHPKRTFELVIDQAVLATIPFAADILAQNEIIFKKWFAKLETFKEKHGSCNVSTVTGEDNKLGVWLANTRHTYKKKKEGDDDSNRRILTDDQIAKLVKLGVVWSLGATRRTFEEHFEELKAFNDVHGRCPTEKDEGHENLYVWLCNTRAAYKKGKSSKSKLSDGQRKLFATIGLVTSFEEKFAENLELLKAFKAENNECCPTASDK
eukprot:scaffold2153_cov271-Chaetoceros_neogracile.AAC.1